MTKSSYGADYEKGISQFFLSCEDSEKALDVVDLVFHTINIRGRDQDYLNLRQRAHTKITPDEAIDELNKRFLENGIGYQFEGGQIIRKDSEIIHSEVVKPVFHFLSENNYEGANEEFLNAHEHYRHGRYKECLNDSLKAFESTMKAICQKRGWQYNQSDTAKKLIDVCLSHNLVPTYLQAQIIGVRTVLESGIPTVRNKLGGHGQGAQQIIVPRYFASYILHLSATTILFLVEAEKELP